MNRPRAAGRTGPVAARGEASEWDADDPFLEASATSCPSRPPSPGRAVSIAEPQMLARLLYTNPVCLLSVLDGSGQRSLMTISWLTCTDNRGGFCCSVNQNRRTAELLADAELFCLGVPVAGMEPLVTAIGSCHGSAHTDKIEQLGIQTCLPGWVQTPECRLQGEGRPPAKGSKKERQLLKLRQMESAADSCLAVRDCVAHLVCRKQSVQDLGTGHNLLICQILCAYVQSEYWSGNTFRPSSEQVPPYLTFFGSAQFGYVKPA